MNCPPKTSGYYHLYGITPEQYCVLWGSGHCPICKRTFSAAPNRRPVLDHDHDTGLLRGLICAGCNYTLGTRKDDWFLAAAQYLVTPPATSAGIDALHKDWREV